MSTSAPPKLRKCAACGHVAVPKRVHFEATDLDGDVCPKCESEDVFDVDDHEGWALGEKEHKARREAERKRRDRDRWG